MSSRLAERFGRLRSRVEITTQDSQCGFLLVYLARRPHTALAEHWHRRAPALQRVLEKEPGHDRADPGESPIHGQSKDRSGAGERRGIHLENALDIPLAVQLLDALGYLYLARNRVAPYRPLCFVADAIVDAA